MCDKLKKLIKEVVEKVTIGAIIKVIIEWF